MAESRLRRKLCSRRSPRLPKIQISNVEIRNKFELRTRKEGPCFLFRNSDLFRISRFGFRIYHSAMGFKMASTPKIYINGKYYDKPDAKISVYDHGLLYGDGVFEGIRIYAGKAFKLKEHVARLFESARHIKLEIPLTPEQMIKAINDTIAANNKKEGYIRPLVTRGVGSLGLDP